MWEIWWTRTAGKEAVDAARRSRFNALVRFARRQSLFHRDAYRGLPNRELDPRELPVVTKPTAIWTAMSCGRVRAARASPVSMCRTVTLWRRSTLMALHLDPVRFATQYSWDLLARGGRVALVAATGDHFASIASWQRVSQSSPWIAARGFSIMTRCRGSLRS